MPSCVVKGCKNYSRTVNKADGVTYHKFPRAVHLRNQWINLLRTNRKDPSWMPSIYSHVCSVHFDETDFYYTKKGRQLTRSKYPKKGLQDQGTSDVCAIGSNEMTSPKDLATTGHLQISENNVYAPANIVFVDTTTLLSPSTSTSTNDRTSTAHEETAHFTSLSDTLTESVKVETVPENECVGTTISDSTYDSITVYTHYTPARTPSPVALTEEEEARSDTPIRHKLRQKLKQKEKLYLKHSKTIKTLRQKVRRLEKRNRMLKYKIKGLNIRNLMYPEMQDALNNAVLDILKNLKRKTRYKKTIICTPAVKQFCITLDHISPKAYAFVRSTFHNCLPHPRNVAKWCRPKVTDPSTSDHRETSQ